MGLAIFGNWRKFEGRSRAICRFLRGAGTYATHTRPGQFYGRRSNRDSNIYRRTLRPRRHIGPVPKKVRPYQILPRRPPLALSNPVNAPDVQKLRRAKAGPPPVRQFARGPKGRRPLGSGKVDFWRRRRRGVCRCVGGHQFVVRGENGDQDGGAEQTIRKSPP